MRRLSIVVAAGLLMAACGPQAPDGAAKNRREVVVAVDAAPGSAAAANWKRFADNVGIWAPEYSLTMRLAAEAGTPTERTAAVQSGTVQIAALSPGMATDLVPELAVLSAPQLFDLLEQADYVADKVVFESYRRLFSEHGLRLLDWTDDGWVDPSTREVYEAGVVVANKDWFDRLTPHDRDVFQQAYGSGGLARADSRAAASIGGQAAGDMAPDGEHRDWTEAVIEAHRAIIDRAGGNSQDIYDLVLRGRQEFADRQAPAGAATSSR
jgi:TRAP-type C4-dicarboxylate transport system substrate-binding protein